MSSCPCEYYQGYLLWGCALQDPYIGIMGHILLGSIRDLQVLLWLNFSLVSAYFSHENILRVMLGVGRDVAPINSKHREQIIAGVCLLYKLICILASIPASETENTNYETSSSE